MYFEAGEPHHSAHFHAYCQNEVAVVGINPIELIAGSLPRKELRLVEAWTELHQDELQTAWNQLQSGRLPSPIAPLH